MRTILAIAFVAACGPPPKKVNTAEERDAPATCCCKSVPVTSVDDKPAYEMMNRMECSTQKGECMPDVQCNGSQKPPQHGDGVPPPPALAPVTTSTPIE
jgi:hypothetical protein